MAKPVLPTDYKDDVLNPSMNGKRKYNKVQNPDGTFSLEDVTQYDQIGSTFGAKQLNGIGEAFNDLPELKVANNDTTTEPGFVADARVVKTHGDEIDALNRGLHALNDSGAIKGLDAREDGVYITYVPSSGADSVTKKLGSGTASISNYIFNFNVSTSGNGSSPGNQGRSGKSEFILNTEDYETLTIGSYKIEGDGDHAAWDPRDCVALSVTINGIKTTVGEGGRTFDVKNADSATIVATFGTNGNPDYGTWATITVSSITLE